MQESGFFNSTEFVEVDGIMQGDKAKDAAFFARYFANFISNGVFKMSSFVPSVLSGMTISISAGSCFINGYTAFDDAAETHTFSVATVQHEYWLIQRLDTANGEITAQWITDPLSGTLPSRTDVVYDIVICKVTIPANASALTAGMITDFRGDAELCGVVSSIADALNGDITPQWAAEVSAMLGCAYSASSSAESSSTNKAATISNTDFTLRTGVLVALTLSNGNTASSVTLNINGLGARSVVYSKSGNVGNYWPSGTALLLYTGVEFLLLNGREDYIPVSGGTMTGQLIAQANTAYTTYQVRNIALSTTAGTPTGNGAILGVYE